ncbi:universal stress protein [Alkalihalobacillus sp. AL-G]|uniref:universal stress protein n=1 Tax=Alkalihalobacillus sp. AL-G TaxID=2926399 RepID=UPI00272BDC5D|nr:universal stress protein [Alkalihalobacillus sp. AL-G]WLD92558.1 universal stress protein [Alkalihalobacillus sp. AL-G]
MIIMYKNILVPIDGSDGSRQALAIGTDLAKKDEAELTVVLVNEEMVMPSYRAGYPISGQHPGVLEKDLRQADASVERHQEFLSEAKSDVQTRHPKVTTQLLEGEPAHSICEYAERKDMDIIVIGSRGLSGLKKLVLGSVSQKVVSHANCPVLVAK